MKLQFHQHDDMTPLLTGSKCMDKNRIDDFNVNEDTCVFEYNKRQLMHENEST